MKKPKRIFKSDAEVARVLDEMRVNDRPLTAAQKAGLKKLYAWLTWASGQKAVKPPIFRLFGLAGTGKTTVLIAIRLLGLRPLYVSFTNRAVGVLVSKGCYPARTVHSVIYVTYGADQDSTAQDEAMRAAFIQAEQDGVPVEERSQLPPVRGTVQFELRTYEEIRNETAGYDCVVVDEASMVGNTMGQDLLTIGLPIVGAGDPGQLPPVGDYPFFDPKGPDVLLTEVLRTDGDILDAAAYVRRGGEFGDLPPGQDYQVRRKAPEEWFRRTDQVLCGIHHKRRELNRHIRSLLGFEGFMPNVGEKLCAVANNKELDISNGSLWIVEKSQRLGDWAVVDLIEFAPRLPEAARRRVSEVKIHLSCLIQDIKSSQDIDLRLPNDAILATWGYSITVHKSQGSEFDNVLIFDDSKVFGESARQWKYTAITRAAKKAFIVSRNGGQK